ATTVASGHATLATKADATPYLGRSSTGWIAPACGWRTHSITSSARSGCLSKFCAVLMASTIARSELIGTKRTQNASTHSRVMAQSSPESTSIFIHSPIWRRWPAQAASSSLLRQVTRPACDPRYYWLPLHKPLPTQEALVLGIGPRPFRQVADTWPLRPADNQPNPLWHLTEGARRSLYYGLRRDSRRSALVVQTESIPLSQDRVTMRKCARLLMNAVHLSPDR